MAPILATATGFAPQILDDPELRELNVNLKALSVDNIEQVLPSLISLLTPWTKDRLFEEQVCTHRGITSSVAYFASQSDHLTMHIFLYS